MVRPLAQDRRQEQEDHREVGELLQHVVALGGLAARAAKAEMVPDVARDVARPKLIGARREIAPEMTAEETEQEIDRAVEDEHPRHQEMPVACEREVRAERRPFRKRAGARPAVGVIGHAEDAGGVDRIVADARGADRLLRLGIVASR